MRTLVVQGSDSRLQHEHAAELRPRIESRLGFRVVGTRVRRMVNQGDIVKAGQRLAQLGARDLALNQIFPQSNISQFILLVKDLAARDRLRHQLPTLLAAEFSEVHSPVKILPNGPPVDFQVMFRVMVPDAAGVRQAADRVKDLLRAYPSMRGVIDNWNVQVKTVRLDIDQDKARALGVNSQGIAQGSRTGLSGVTVGQYREGDKLVDIVLRQPLEARNAITDIANSYMPTSSRRAIPLTQIARIGFGWEPCVMWRESRQFAITVQGDVIAALRVELLPGYEIRVAGAQEQSSKGQGSIVAGVPIMLFLIFTLLMLQLQSFQRAQLVFLTGPLGVAGVAGALLLLNRPSGFVALLGVIALMGMIMRNSAILIDQIEQDRARGMPAWDAVVGAAVRRFGPIVLTAAAAVLAMIPLSRSVFWGPTAVAIMGGRVVATELTLLALPAMYVAWFRVCEPRRADSEPPAGSDPQPAPAAAR